MGFTRAWRIVTFNCSVNTYDGSFGDRVKTSPSQKEKLPLDFGNVETVDGDETPNEKTPGSVRPVAQASGIPNAPI